MFESVVHPRKASKASWSLGTFLTLVVHAALIGFALYLSQHPPERNREEAMVTFVRPPPPPPPPPPPKRSQPQARVERKPIRKPDTMIQPKETPVVPPPPEEPPPAEDDEGVEGGVEGGVAGGVVGGVLGGAIGGQLGGQGPPQPRLEVEDAVVHLVKIAGPQIQYTQKAQEMEIEGIMVVKCVVTIQGSVRQCRVLKSLPYMDHAVIDALERTTYKPYVFQGQPREVDCTFRVRLQLPR